MVTYLGSLVQLCCGEGGTLQKNITVGSAHNVWATLSLPQLTTCMLSWPTLLGLQVTLHGTCIKRAPGCVHFPGLSHSGSGSRVLHKSTDFVGPAFFALPKSEQLRLPGAWQAHSSRWAVYLSHLPSLSHSVSQVCHESTVSACDTPHRCQLSRIPGRHG